LEYLKWAQDARVARVAQLEKSGSTGRESAHKMLLAFDSLIASITRGRYVTARSISLVRRPLGHRGACDSLFVPRSPFCAPIRKSTPSFPCWIAGS